MGKDKQKGIQIRDVDERRKRKREEKKYPKVEMMKTRASSSKRTYNKDKHGERKGKHIVRCVITTSDSDFESDEESKKRKVQISASESEDLESEDTVDSEDEVKVKHKSSKKYRYVKIKNKFDKVNVVSKNNYYRSNLRTSFYELEQFELREEHYKELKHTPFWLLLEAILINGNKKMIKNTSKFEEDIIEIVRNFDEDSERFLVSSTKLGVNKHDAEVIFGIVSGEEKVAMRGTNYAHPTWVQRCFGQELEGQDQYFILYKNIIKRKINEFSHRTDKQSIQDVARLLCMYVMAGILCPLRSGAVSWFLTSYLEDFYEMCKYDWSSYIVEVLMTQIKKSKALKSGGCAMLLPYWLCEHTTWVDPVDEKAFPRFLKWDLHDLNYAISRGKLHRHSRVSTGILKATHWEKKQFSELAKFRDAERSLRAITKVSNIDEGRKVKEKSTGDGLSVGRSKSVYNRNVVLGESSSKHVGSTSKVNDVIFEDGPSFDLGNDFTPISNGASYEDIVKKVCTDLNNTELNRDETTFESPKIDMVNKEVEDVNDVNPIPDFGDDIIHGETAEELRRQIVVLRLDNELKSKKVEELVVELDNLKKDMEKKLSFYEVERKASNDIIQRLELEKELLTGEAAMMRTPCKINTVYEDQEVLDQIDEIENAELQKSSSEKVFTEVNTGSAEVGQTSEKTPSPKVLVDKKKKKLVQPSSLILRVRGRTLAGDRKSVQMSPQILTQDLLHVHEITDVEAIEDENADTIPKINNNVKYPFDNRLLTVKNCPNELKDHIFSELKKHGESKVIYMGTGPLTSITLHMVISLINNKTVDNEVIDVWAEVVRNMLYQRCPSTALVTVFTSSCWTLITKRDISKQKCFSNLIEKYLDDAVNKDILLFPVIVGQGDSMSRTNVTGHWTLLKLDLRSSEWTFYNSLRPRSKGVKDHYLVHAKLLVKYVEAKLTTIFNKCLPKHPFLKGKGKDPIPSEIMQQGQGTLDCGIVVCKLIEYFLRGQEPPNSAFCSDEAMDMRVKIAGAFVDPFRYLNF